jgi:hypothetical protein
MTIIVCDQCGNTFDDNKPYFWVDIMHASTKFVEDHITDWQFCSRYCLLEYDMFPQLEDE